MSNNTLIRWLAFASLTVAAALPTQADAASIGYHGTSYGENPAGVITAAGHTPVPVVTLDAASLAGLKGLLVGSDSFVTNPAVNAAVNAGMVLIVHAPSDNLVLPGATFVRTGNYGANIDFTTAAAPFLTGPAGTVNNASLDGGNFSNHGSVSASSLQAGVSTYATTANAAEVVTFGYSYGAGRVIGSTIPLGCYFQNGNCVSIQPTAAGMQAYATNLLASLVPSFTTCAAEGFTGGKLTLCQKICEVDQTPTTLSGLIRLYRAAYRQDPPCAD